RRITKSPQPPTSIPRTLRPTPATATTPPHGGTSPSTPSPNTYESIKITRELVTAFGDALAVLILTDTEAGPDPAHAIKAGARGYLTRASAVSILCHAVHCVAARGMVFEPAGVGQILLASRLPGEGIDVSELLSEREQTVFYLLANGLSNSEIAAELSVAASTVKKHVSAVLRKLDLRDRQQAAVVGNRSRDDPSRNVPGSGALPAGRVGLGRQPRALLSEVASSRPSFDVARSTVGMSSGYSLTAARG
ncbi:response regulator transcription factor, partial [Frankia sp. B2]